MSAVIESPKPHPEAHSRCVGRILFVVAPDEMGSLPSVSAQDCDIWCARTPEETAGAVWRGIDVIITLPGGIQHLRGIQPLLTRWTAPEVILLSDDSIDVAALTKLGTPPSVVLPRADGDQVTDAIQLMFQAILPMRRALIELVGRFPMKSTQQLVRWVMVREALARTNHNRGWASRLLGVSRPAVQQMISRLDVPIPP